MSDNDRLDALERRMTELEQREQARAAEEQLVGTTYRGLSARALPSVAVVAEADAKLEKLDSLMPMQQEQLEILRRSEAERKKRAENDAERVAREKRWQEYRELALKTLAVLMIAMQILFELLRQAAH